MLRFCPVPLSSRLFVFLSVVVWGIAPLYSQETNLVYPETRTVNHVDQYHGTEVTDPYRWLEEDVRESHEVADWVAAENIVTFGYLK
ncbi:MAG: hypothetical protein KDA85_21585, partial [Planctomycetaceae bacterium]|nr:hypothetical protein [Planctomycetaceae bacterium]